MISVIVCTYNRSAILKRVLLSLNAMVTPDDLDWELLVVDNNSEDATHAVVAEFARTSRLMVRYIFESEQGLSHARNRGISEARGQIVAFTDDDVIVDQHWLANVARAFESSPCIAVGGKIVPLWYGPKPSWFYEERPYPLTFAIAGFDLGTASAAPTKEVFGANMAFRSDAFKQYGNFRTDLGRFKDILLVGEETEFCERLLKAGESIMYTPYAIVHHPVDPDRTRRSYFQSWYYNFGRSRVRVAEMVGESISYFGVPRFFFRDIVTSIIKW